MERTDRAMTIAAISAGVLIVLLLGYVFLHGPAEQPGSMNDSTTTQPAPQATGDTGNLSNFSINPGITISGSKTITGTLSGGYFFEAQARGELLDASKHILKTFPITATSEWMTSGPVQFVATIDTTGVAPQEGYVRISNDNPSGDPSLDKYIDIPVSFR